MASMLHFNDGQSEFLETASEIPVDSDWRPSPDFVICRDAQGTLSVIYGGDIWDLNPLRLKANKIGLISFNSIFDKLDAERAGLVEEVRYLLFCLLFYVRAGKLGRLSAETLVKYFSVLRVAVRYCYAQKANPLIGIIVSNSYLLILRTLMGIATGLLKVILAKHTGRAREPCWVISLPSVNIVWATNCMVFFISDSASTIRGQIRPL